MYSIIFHTINRACPPSLLHASIWKTWEGVYICMIVILQYGNHYRMINAKSIWAHDLCTFSRECRDIFAALWDPILLLLTLGACVRVMVVVLCVCVRICLSVTTLTATYLVFFIEIQVSLGFLCRFQHMHCVDFAEKTLFKSSGNICWIPLPSSLLGQLSVDKRDSNGFF